jgi:predicted  nucleic acid-binding Zn-ribbon protein
MPQDAGMIWSSILSIGGALFVWWVRGISSQVQDVRRRIADTREEVAKTYVTKGDLQQDMKALMNRFDRLEEKFDRLMLPRQVP